ncbi:LysR family transcriptional regulator [Xylocopilactobacillus apicola]|uniref:LysR family transcriptional regulator n=1 Tax=Xylocopilactobacillus apicola TaxID=2932184 RepID=A0AAU9CX55_9LACO|nr:LysR family transcriptional regulator [Xylocopilactobacillus apicola]BDR58574.1 LysR family transcriptional regulator [Xylocopilactobacillus apicola]
MNINQLKGFVLVVQNGNLTQAAKKLFVSQPAMTKLIHQLEEELETELFTRQGRAMKLNAAGKLFYPYANSIIEQWQKGMDALKQQKDNNIEPIKIYVQVASSLIPEIIKSIRTIFPNVPIQLNQRITAIPNAQEFDFIISNRPESNDDRGLTVIPLAREEIYVGGSSGQIHNQNITLAEIAKLPIVMLGLHTPLRSELDLYFENHHCHLKYQFESDDPATIRELLLSNAGIGFIPAISWRKVGEKLHLARIVPDAPGRTIYLTYSTASHTKRNQIIAKTLEKVFSHEAAQALKI